ncbi:MAG: hypothetical protein WBF36_10795 [Desulfobulbales bacterium]|jgi:hypothetical protein
MEVLSAKEWLFFQEQTLIQFNVFVMSIESFRLQTTEELFPQQEDITL